MFNISTYNNAKVNGNDLTTIFLLFLVTIFSENSHRDKFLKYMLKKLP